MEEDKKFSFFFLGLGIGVAVGVLFAPKSGEETRDLLLNKADEGKELLKKRAGEFKESASEWIDRGKTTVDRQKESLNAAVQAGKQAYRETVGDVSRKVKSAVDDLAEGV
jgi:gas vesicle protein